MSMERKCFFPQAVTFPDFFNHNLTDENRILKVVTGKNCWARAFYYQLLKIVFEIQPDSQQKQQKPVDHVAMLINFSKQIIAKLQDRQHADRVSQAVSIVQNFLKTLQNNPSLSFEQHINNHSLIDTALITLLTEILNQAGYSQFRGQQKIKYLGELFEEHMYEFEKGIKFQESDTFIYFQKEDCVYIAFLGFVTEFEEFQGLEEGEREEEEKKDASIEGIGSSRDEGVMREPIEKYYGDRDNVNSSVSPVSPLEQPQQISNQGQAQPRPQSKLQPQLQAQSQPQPQPQQQPQQPPQPKPIKQSPIDYLLHNKFRANSNINTTKVPTILQQQPLVKDLEIGNQKQNQKQKDKDISLEFTLGYKEKAIDSQKVQHNSQQNSGKGSNMNMNLNQIKIKHADTIEESTVSDYKINRKQSVVQQKIVSRNFDQIVQERHEDLLYKPIPTGIYTSPNYNYTNSPSSVNSRQPPAKKDPLDILDDSQKGTFYRKFTDTRILNMLAQPYRSKVKMLKNRFVGVHGQGGGGGSGRNYRGNLYTPSSNSNGVNSNGLY